MEHTMPAVPQRQHRGDEESPGVEAKSNALVQILLSLSVAQNDMIRNVHIT